MRDHTQVAHILSLRISSQQDRKEAFETLKFDHQTTVLARAREKRILIYGTRTIKSLTSG